MTWGRVFIRMEACNREKIGVVSVEYRRVSGENMALEWTGIGVNGE